MSRKPITLTVFALALSLLAFLLILPPAMAQGPDPQPPFAVYFARLRLPEPGAHGDAMASFRVAYDRLRPTLLELKADGQILSFEPLPELRSIRLVATDDVIAALSVRPEVAEIKPLHARAEAKSVDEAPPSERPSPVALPEQPSPVASVAAPLMAAQTYTISGTVRDYDGTPIENAWVHAIGGPVSDYDYTDAGGVYTLTVSAGTYTIRVSKGDLPSPPGQTVTVPPDQVVDFTFPQRFTISGTVRDYDDTPMEGAWVSISGGPVSDSDHTDASGVYTLTVTAGTYTVRASKSGLPGPPGQTVTVPPDQVVDFTFPQRLTISGTVRDYDGTPIDGVWVSTDPFDDPVYVSDYTDASGVYTLTVSAGTYTVRASKSGLPSPPGQTVTVPPDQVVDFTFPERFTISGTVRDYNGTPLEDAWVRTSGGPVSDSDHTDASGVYTLTVTAGTYTVRVQRYYNQLDPPEQIVTVPPDQVVDFTFPERFTISGTVRDHNGTPVEGAWIHAIGGPVSDYDYTDATGVYTLTVTAGTYTVRASKSGYPEPDAQSVTVPPDATGVDFTFPQPYTITGVVRDEAGNPLGGASIWGGLSSATTAANGTYTITVGPGEHSLSAHKEGYEDAPSVLAPTPPDVAGVDFVLRLKDQVIRGRVTDDQGRPVADAWVSAEHIVCGALGDDVTRTTANGAYTLTIASGIYWVEVEKDGYVPAPPEEVTVLAGTARAAEAQVNFTLQPAMYSIRGTVRNSLGQPLAGAWVYASACGLRYDATTDATGAYTLTVSAEKYSVYAYKWDYPDSDAQTISAPPNAAGVNFIMPPTYTISGRVTDDQGQPIEDVYVRTAWPYPYYDSDWTDASGWYTLTVRSGDYNIRAEKAGYATPANRAVTVPPDQPRVNFTMSPLAWDQNIQGMVRDESGRPAAEARVSVSLVSGQGFGTSRQVYYNGTYSTTLTAGTYNVYAYASCYVSSAGRQVTLPPSRSGLDFTLRHQDQLISGRVTDSDHNPICSARVEADDGAYDYDYSERNGRYALQLPAGTYTVSASRSGYSPPPDKAVIVPPHATGTDFVFQAPGNTVRGTVRDNHGVAVSGATVSASGAGGSVSTVTGADGSYTLRVIDGTWTVSASKPDHFAFPTSRTVRVPPDQAGVDFTLVPRAELSSIYLPLIVKTR